MKYNDHVQTEMLVDVQVEERFQERNKDIVAEAQSKGEQIGLLTETNTRLDNELNEIREHSGRTISKQNALIQNAKDRLTLLGHAPTCDSRYGTIAVDGQKQANECSCGLSEWMKESGLG